MCDHRVLAVLENGLEQTKKGVNVGVQVCSDHGVFVNINVDISEHGVQVLMCSVFFVPHVLLYSFSLSSLQDFMPFQVKNKGLNREIY